MEPIDAANVVLKVGTAYDFQDENCGFHLVSAEPIAVEFYGFDDHHIERLEDGFIIHLGHTEIVGRVQEAFDDKVRFDLKQYEK